MGPSPVPSVPDDVARAVARFLLDRSRDPGGPEGLTSGDRADLAALVQSYQRADARGRRLTAENLAATMVLAADRFAHHPDHQPQWSTWLPFGDLHFQNSQHEADPQAEQRHRGAGHRA